MTLTLFSRNSSSSRLPPPRARVAPSSPMGPASTGSVGEASSSAHEVETAGTTSAGFVVMRSAREAEGLESDMMPMVGGLGWEREGKSRSLLGVAVYMRLGLECEEVWDGVVVLLAVKREMVSLSMGPCPVPQLELQRETNTQMFGGVVSGR